MLLWFDFEWNQDRKSSKKKNCSKMVESDLLNKNLLSDSRQGNKAQIVPVQTKTLQHLPKRPAVDLAFHNLTYRVKEGNRSSKYY